MCAKDGIVVNENPAIQADAFVLSIAVTIWLANALGTKPDYYPGN